MDPIIRDEKERPAQSLEDWKCVYEGLSEPEIDTIDRVAKERANLTRLFPPWRVEDWRQP